MNGLQNINQTAGNDWHSKTLPMLHERIDNNPTKNINWSYDNSMFKDMELQVRVSEAEFQATSAALRTKFIFTDAAVEDFLKTHRAVAPLLLEAAPQMSAAFGEETLLALEVMTEETPARTIYALALWGDDRADSRLALRRFDEAWLKDNLRKIAGMIVFDYELV